MKSILTSLLILGLVSCSSPIDGLWIEVNEKALLKFYKDSVINNSLQTTMLRDTFGFRLTNDSITWTGLNPEWNHGQTENSFTYTLNNDTLKIWFKPDDKFVYFKSRADNFKEYFLKKNSLQLRLPEAQNVMPSLRRYEPLNIRIGFDNRNIRVFVDNKETSISDLDNAIKKFKSRAYLNELWSPRIICQLFIDKDVTCEYTFSLFDHLRANDIRVINFVTETARYNPYTTDFWGLTIKL